MAETEKIKTSCKNWDDVNAAFERAATASIKHKAAKSKMDSEVLEIQKKYNDTLDALTKEITDNSQDIVNYCKLHKGEFSKDRTKTLHYGEISLRLSPPALYMLPKFDLVKVIDKIRSMFKGKKADSYIKVKEDIDKTALKKLDAKTLKQLGLEVTQGEAFTITPNEINVMQAQINNQSTVDKNIIAHSAA